MNVDFQELLIGLGNRCTAVCHQTSFDSLSLLFFKSLTHLSYCQAKDNQDGLNNSLSFIVFYKENVPVKIKLVVD